VSAWGVAGDRLRSLLERPRVFFGCGVPGSGVVVFSVSDCDRSLSCFSLTGLRRRIDLKAGAGGSHRGDWNYRVRSQLVSRRNADSMVDEAPHAQHKCEAGDKVSGFEPGVADAGGSAHTLGSVSACSVPRASFGWNRDGDGAGGEGQPDLVRCLA
jgi:hypothetical protein